MTAASITSSASPFELLRVKPLKDRVAQQQQGDDSDDAAKAPSNDILRMLQGVLQPKASKQADASAPTSSAAATSQTDAVFAQVQVNGKTIATIYNSGASETTDASGTKTRTNGSGGPDLAQQRAQDLAAASGGTIVKADGALSQAEWLESQAGKPGALEDPVAQAKQTSYSGLQQRTMIANPSMLLQAQLFAQQSFGFDAKAAMQYVPHVDDQMGGATGAFA